MSAIVLSRFELEMKISRPGWDSVELKIDGQEM